MKYKIVADSCCEFPDKFANDPRYETVALGLEVAGELIMDDETFDQRRHTNVRNPFAHHRRNLRKLTGQKQRMCLYLRYPLS